MSLSYISPSNREKERQILISIFNSLDKNENIIFNSGAGAGKTYALIESLRYVINKYGENLKEHNQKVICITYTNVATEEVKERLGNTDLVLVSTIHERIWGLIKDYKKELVQIHKEKLEKEVANLKQELDTDKKYEKFRELDKEQKIFFTKIMMESKKLFYQNYSVGAADLRNVFQKKLNMFPDILKNVGNFRKIVSTIYKIDNYTKSYENIKSNKQGYKSVEYKAIYNKDQLHKMRISHDTLLEYGENTIKKFDLLKQIIIDTYPYIFIDEYQDTNEKVVSIMNYLQSYARKIDHNNFIGYFGDSAQNIYNDGVGKRITEIQLGLKPVNKEFNRRSTKEVIDVINQIRNDNIHQRSIYDDCEGGSVKFYTGNPDKTKEFINKYVHEWKINLKNQLHCFVLTNQTVAKYSGFENIYNTFKETDKYSINFDQLNTELLSNDPLKRGEIPNLLFEIVRLKNNLGNGQTPVIDILRKSIYEDMNILDLRKLIELLQKNEANTLGEYIESISTTYFQDVEGKYKKVIDIIFDFEDISIEIFKNHLLEKLFPDLLDDEIEKANRTIQELLEINMYEYDLWYKYILNKHEDKIIYHTYHGTKGLEFENVIIIMENAFGRSKKNYFNFFFENCINSKSLEGEEKLKFEQIQNLLYVSCSRAIKNLRVLYIDDVTPFKNGIEKIFGKIHSF